MPKHPIPWTENHRVFSLDPKTGTTNLIFHYVPFNVTIHNYTCQIIQYHGPKTIASKTMDQKPSCPKPCAKIMHKTIDGSAQPIIGSIFFSRGAALGPVEGGYLPPSNPPDRGATVPPPDPPHYTIGAMKGRLHPPLTPQLTT